MRRLFVTADDFGLSSGINHGVQEAVAGGMVTRVSIAPVGAAFDEAVGLLRAMPACGLGLHLVLNEERPLCPLPRIRSLTGSDGRFHKTWKHLALRSLAGTLDGAEIEREWRAQIGRALESGLRPKHLDTHGHVAILPGCIEAFVRIAAESDIGHLRLPTGPLGLEDSSPLRPWRSLLLAAACARSRRLRAGLPEPLRGAERVVGLRHSGRLDKRRLLALLRRLPDGVTELVCHPGLADAETRARYGHWGYDWEGELRALTDPEVRDFIAGEGIVLA